MSDPAAHIAALDARYQADLAALREQAKLAGDRVVTAVDELRVLAPAPAPAAALANDFDDIDPIGASDPPLPDLSGEEGFDLDAPVLEAAVATDDDGIPIWSDP